MTKKILYLFVLGVSLFAWQLTPSIITSVKAETETHDGHGHDEADRDDHSDDGDSHDEHGHHSHEQEDSHDDHGHDSHEKKDSHSHSSDKNKSTEKGKTND